MTSTAGQKNGRRSKIDKRFAFLCQYNKLDIRGDLVDGVFDIYKPKDHPNSVYYACCYRYTTNAKKVEVYGYGVKKNIKSMYKHIINTVVENRNYFEVTGCSYDSDEDDRRAIKFYIDCETPKGMTLTKKEYKKRLITIIEASKIVTGENRTLEYNSHIYGEDGEVVKFSNHILLPTIYTKHEKDTKNIAYHIRDKANELYPGSGDIMDMNVYTHNRNFRFLYCCKIGKPAKRLGLFTKKEREPNLNDFRESLIGYIPEGAKELNLELHPEMVKKIFKGRKKIGKSQKMKNVEKKQAIRELVSLIDHGDNISYNDWICITWAICKELGTDEGKIVSREFCIRCEKDSIIFRYNSRDKMSEQEQLAEWIQKRESEADELCDRYDEKKSSNLSIDTLLNHAKKCGKDKEVAKWEEDYATGRIDTSSNYEYNDWLKEMTDHVLTKAELYELIYKMTTVMATATNSGAPIYILKDNKDDYVERDAATFQRQLKHTVVRIKDDRDINLEEENDKQKTKKEGIVTTTLWKIVSHNEYRTRYNRVIFKPFSPDKKHKSRDRTNFNLFTGFKALPVPSESLDKNKIKLVLWHIRNIWAGSGSDRKANGRYIISWFAHLVQKPEEKIGSMMLFISRCGAGKNILLDWIIDYLLGKNFAYFYAKEELVLGKFNTAVKNRILIALNELNLADKSDLGVLKSLITDKKQNIEGKHANSYDSEIYANFLAFTNLLLPIMLEKADRRTAVFDVNNIYANTLEGLRAPGAREYFQALKNDLTEESASHFMRYLLDYDISDWDAQNIPLTAARKRMMAESTNDVETFIEEFSWMKGSTNYWDEKVITEEDYVPDFDGFRPDELYQHYKTWGGQKGLGKFRNGLAELSSGDHPKLFVVERRSRTKNYYPRFYPRSYYDNQAREKLVPPYAS